MICCLLTILLFYKRPFMSALKVCQKLIWMKFKMPSRRKLACNLELQRFGDSLDIQGSLQKRCVFKSFFIQEKQSRPCLLICKQASERDEDIWHAFRHTIGFYEPYQLFFVDESPFDQQTTYQDLAWGIKGMHVHQSVGGRRWKGFLQCLAACTGPS